MSRKNRMQQPYGYREQNKFTSEPSMVCDAISASGSDKDIIKQLVEKLNTIFNKAFVDSQYNKDNEEFEFHNYYGAEVANVEFPFIVKNAFYNKDDEKIVINFKDETIDPVEIDMSDLVSLINNEAETRENEDKELWDAVGEIGASGTSIMELITQEISARTDGDEDLWEALNQETSARTEGDEDLWEALNQEVSARTDEDQKIWDAVGEMGASGTSIMELITQEISARTDGDSAIDEKLEEEVSARTDEDQKIWDAIGEIGTSGSSIIEIINNEISARTEGDEDLWEALNQEVSARTDGDSAIDEKLEEEKNNRATADDELEDKIDAEKSEREASDSALTDAIAAEKAARLYWDNQLSGAVNTEKSERENKDNEILSLLNDETEARENKDEELSNLINNNKVSIIKVETALPTNVKEAYELKNAVGEVLGERINIYKDSSLKNVELTDQDDRGRTGQFLKLTYILEDGTEKVEYLDVSKFLVEAEFKDGLVVNDAGEVRVKIDPISEAYISVSQNGVKVSGIDAITQNLDSEIVNRQNADTLLETSITNESTARQSADSELSNLISDEKAERESAFSGLNALFISEKAERVENDTALSALINTEINNRTSADQSLNRALTQISTDLADEISSRSSGDSNLQEQVNALKAADIEIRSNISNVEDNLESEINNRTQADDDLQLQINKKANSVDVYYKTEADSIFATKDEIPTDFYGKSEVDEKDTAIKQMITAETAVRETEDVRLNNAITAETQTRESTDAVLQNNINSLEEEIRTKVVEVKATDASITVDNTDTTKPEIKLNVSAEDGQIIKLNADGIYAKSTLGYDEEHNILLYTNTTGTTAIALKTKSEIDRIYYDKQNERIVIEYTVNGTRKEDVYVPVHDLIEEWRTEDGNVGAIALSKDISIPEADVLKARLILNTAHGDNAAIIDDNALYVSKNAIVSGVTEEINALKARVSRLEAALQLATQEHTTQSQRITQVEEKNTSQDDKITEIDSKNQSQDESIANLLNYINVNTEP